MQYCVGLLHFRRCALLLFLFFIQDANYEELKAVASSYSFHGRAAPKLLAENGKLNPEALVTKCKLSLCVPCFKGTPSSKAQELKSVNDGSHVSLRYSPNEFNSTDNKTATVDNSTVSEINERLTTAKLPNGNDMQIRLPPVCQSQSCTKSPTNGIKSETGQNSHSGSKFLEVKPSWARTLTVISENETTEVENHFTREDNYDGQRRVTFPEISTGISPLGTPRGSVGSLRKGESQEQTSRHRKGDLSRRKTICKRITKLTMDPLFEMFITFCILLNTLFLSLEYHDMNKKFKMALDIGNMVSVMYRNHYCLPQLIAPVGEVVKALVTDKI